MTVSLIFEGVDSHGDVELWKSLGTGASATMVPVDGLADGGDGIIGESLYGSENDNPGFGATLFVDDGLVYLSANFPDGGGAYSAGLWVSNGTTNTLIDKGNTGPGLAPQDFVSYDGEVYFDGLDDGGLLTSHELFVTNGTAAGTFQLSYDGLEPSSFCAYGYDLYFNGEASDGAELFSYNADSGGLTQLTSGGFDPTDLTSAVTGEFLGGPPEDTLYMTGLDSGGKRGLFAFDGSALSEVAAGAAAGGLNPIDITGLTTSIPLDGTTFDEQLVYFSGVDKVVNGTAESGLWYGNQFGVTEVTASSVGGYSAGLDPYDLVGLNGDLYFTGYDNGPDVSARGLFVYDPLTGKTTEVVKSSSVNIPDGEVSAWGDNTPTALTAYDGSIYFSGSTDGGADNDLWRFTPVVGKAGTSSETISGTPVELSVNGSGENLFPLYLTTYDEITPPNVFNGGGQNIILSDEPGNEADLFNTNGDWDAVDGTSGAVEFTSAQASIFGGDDTIDFVAGTGNAVSLYQTDGGVGDFVEGESGTVYVTQSAAAIFGGGFSIFVENGAGSLLYLHGADSNWDSVSGADAVIYLYGSRTSVTGGDEAIYVESGDDNAASFYSSDGNWDLYYGSNSTIYLTDAQASVSGEADTVDFIGASGDQVSLYGSNDVWDSVVGLSGATGTVYLTDAQASVVGGGFTINLQPTSTSANEVSLYQTNGDWDAILGTSNNDDTIYLSDAQASVFNGGHNIEMFGDTGNAVSAYNTGNDWDTIVGSSGTVYLTSAQASVFGSLDTIDFAAGSGNAVSLYATDDYWDSVTGSDGVIYLTGSQASVVGDGNTIYFNGGTGNIVSVGSTGSQGDTVDGSGGVIDLYDSWGAVNGSSDTVNFNGNSAINFVDGSERMAFHQGIGGQDWVVGFASSDVIQVSKSDFADFSALSQHLTESSGNAVITLNASDTITLQGVQTANLTAAQFAFV